MWLSRLFGRRPKPRIDEDEEPARFPSPASPQATGAYDVKKRTPEQSKQPGFDPYNSGTFKKDDAWKRVNRR